MRTIIVNTLGDDFRPSDLYFRAFQNTDLVWISAALDEIETCAEQIDHLRSRQNIGQGYHLVVLANVGQYENSVYSKTREKIRTLLAAYVGFKLLPELEKREDLPRSVSVVGICTENWDEREGTSDYVDLLHLDPANPALVPMLHCRGGSGKNLSFAGMFEDHIHACMEQGLTAKVTPAEEEKTSGVTYEAIPDGNEEDPLMEEDTPQEIAAQKQVEEDRLFAIGKSISEQIEKRAIELANFRVKANAQEVLTVQECEFLSKVGEEPCLVYADLQINLAQYVYAQMSMKTMAAKLELQPNSSQELAELIYGATRKVDALLQDQEGPMYFPLKDAVDNMEIEKHQESIEQRLKAILPSDEDTQQSADPKVTRKEVGGLRGLFDKEKRAWLRYSREKKRFEDKFRQLQEQYDPAAIAEEEKHIMEICAEELADWRRKVRHTVAGTLTPNETTRPNLEDVSKPTAGTQVQKELLSGTLEKLADLEDVREKAEVVRQDFVRASRIWEPDHPRHSLRSFRRLTLTMAVICVLVMLIPYAVMAWSAEKLIFPEITVLAISAIVFLALYLVAVLLWLWGVCGDMFECTTRLGQLIEKSVQVRKESIKALVEVYAQMMPECMRERLVYDCMEETDRINEERENCWVLHRCYLTDARAELSDLRTALRIPEEKGKSEKEAAVVLDYAQPPYAKANRDCYLFFPKAKEGKK